MTHIAFFGLGNMGSPMAANLLKAGHSLKVYDPVTENTAAAAELGAQPAENPSAAIVGAETVISMLPSDETVSELYNTLLNEISPPTLIIDCSTISAATSRQLAQQAEKQQLSMLDAPVSGGTKGAAAGALTFIVGGERQAFEQAQPVLRDMGQQIFHAGGSGAGQQAKICNNMLLAVTMAGTAEALQLGVDNGLDPEVLSNIMRDSSGGNWVLNGYNPYPGVMENVPAANGYDGGFMVKLMNKDLNLALDSAQQSHSNTPMGGLAKSLFQLLQQMEQDSLDFSSIQNLYRKQVDL
ncbi:MAG: 3-hydroxyisobutyrate dehydrogenase [Lentisphaeria bacterium]|jgi:3-hydroxyisobutyrate dehydrogenase|nr:3-hydroxyisobutyrate dehydrogenase [Lentisphaeria bacterium]